MITAQEVLDEMNHLEAVIEEYGAAWALGVLTHVCNTRAKFSHEASVRQDWQFLANEINGAMGLAIQYKL